MKIEAGKKIKVTRGNTPFKRVLSTLGTFILIATVTYAFLTLCNWSYDMQDWSGFSRFILGAEGVIFLIKVVDEL